MEGSGDTAQHWLTPLRDGTPDQRALAATELGLIFEQRGMLDEAADAYQISIRARVSDRQPPTSHLIRIVAQRGLRGLPRPRFAYSLLRRAQIVAQ